MECSFLCVKRVRVLTEMTRPRGMLLLQVTSTATAPCAARVLFPLASLSVFSGPGAAMSSGKSIFSSFQTRTTACPLERASPWPL